ncbi:hypothetical protein KM1_003310 [Entamoeba histolytica HM-3:IMSS]|uniref:Uncharacterized protein n=2 Tax=Entamoeba histolytica TaxID=5759 RepID=M2RW50_ENTHI|nr:Hypothetical protein EHI5A_002340 [Entamoeba histolytica KU27]EMS15666.1 hypothetical protein KM1_003310 [Entamoeba histolytica HM-3:IMSS]
MFLLFISFVFICFSQTTCNNAIDINFSHSEIFQHTADTSRIPDSYYILKQHLYSQKGIWYRVSLSTPQTLIIDTCFTGHTVFDTKIMVFSQCENNSGSKLLAINDDGINGCGKASRLIYCFTKPSYIFITGATQLDTGIFGLRISPLPKQENTNPLIPEKLSIPTSIEGITSGINSSVLYYTFEGLDSTPIKVSTCHPLTNTQITLILDKNTPNQQQVVDNCPSHYFGAEITVPIGKTVHSLQVQTNNPGHFILSLKLPSTQQTPIAIRELPFLHSSKPSGDISKSCEGYPEQSGTWYAIIGTGEDYLISTCESSLLREGVGTTVEIFDSNGECKRDSFGCGIHGRIIKKLEYKKEYFIKVSCQENNKCKATLLVQKILQSSEECKRPVILEIGEEGIVSHSKIGHLSHPCEPISIHGSWYLLNSRINKDFMIFGGVIDGFNASGNVIYTKTCRGPCKEESRVLTTTFKKNGEYLFVVSVSSILVSGVSLFVVPIKQTDCSDTIQITPFSTLGILQDKKHYYSFEGDGSMFIIETCGPDTQIDTIITVYSSCNSYRPLIMNDDSEICGNTASFIREKFIGKFIVVVDVSHKSERSIGPYRLNVYKDIEYSNDNCLSPTEITEGTHFIYTYNNRYVLIPNRPDIQSKGAFLLYKGRDAVVTTCNSMVTSRIEVLSDCSTVLNNRHLKGYCRNGEKVIVHTNEILFIGGKNSMDMGLIQIEAFASSRISIYILFGIILIVSLFSIFYYFYTLLKNKLLILFGNTMENKGYYEL